mgnify:CR=1 FL=1
MSTTRAARPSAEVVLVTGAASGIGRALAHSFSAQGCRLALVDRDQDGLARVAAELALRGAEASAHLCDVTDLEACRAAVAEGIARHGGIDVLINNAGITHRSLFADTDPSVIRRVMEVNFFGAVNFTHAALETVVARRGMIVAISSVAGFAPLVARTGYAASKHALHGFFGSLRAELRHRGTGVLLVCPSYAATSIDASALGGDGQRVGGRKATIGRLLSAEEMADAIVRAVNRRAERLLLSPVTKSSYWLWTLVPRVYEHLMRASHEGELEG